MFLVLLLSLSGLIILVDLVQSNPVVGGQYVGEVVNNNLVHNPAKYPFLVLVEVRELRYIDQLFGVTAACGGTILTDEIVMTAAHCLEFFVTTPHVTVTAGIVHKKLEKPAHRTCIKSYLIHEQHQSIEIIRNSLTHDDNMHDIALLWVEKKFTFNFRVGPATLAKNDIMEPQKGTIVGWGGTETEGLSDLLKEGELSLLDNHRCTAYFDIKVTDKYICGISDNKKTAICGGDSGSPFIINNVVAGITLFSHNIEKSNKCDPTGPSVFTRVSEYYSWIQKYTAKEETKDNNGNFGLPAFPVYDFDLECLKKDTTPIIPTATTSESKQCDKKSKKKNGKKKYKGCVIS